MTRQVLALVRQRPSARALAAVVAATVLCGCISTAQVPNAASASTVLGLRSIVMHVHDLAAAREWYAQALLLTPQTDTPSYVGFRLADNAELGIDSDVSALGSGMHGAGPVAYLGVADIEMAFERMLNLGADPVTGVQEVSEQRRLVVLRDPFGNLFGLIEDPLYYGVAGAVVAP